MKPDLRSNVSLVNREVEGRKPLPDSSLNIATLMEAHQQGDPHAFESLLQCFKGDLWGYLVNRVHTHQDAEDLFQEICLKVLKNLGSLREPARFRSWLFSIAMNTVRSFFRKKAVIKAFPGEAGNPETDPPSREPGAQARLESREELQRLRQCIHALSERDREVLLLDAMAGLPQQDIARQLGLNLNTVKTIIRRSKIKLARMMVEVAHG